ncbi:MAG: hypothetical protein FWG14_11920, partial [Peptococcaceae bacterium]|nr:hypothetical protein [Peptococcaceae bacterium]
YQRYYMKIRTNFSEITNYWRHYGFYQGRIPFVTILFAVESKVQLGAMIAVRYDPVDPKKIKIDKRQMGWKFVLQELQEEQENF